MFHIFSFNVYISHPLKCYISPNNKKSKWIIGLLLVCKKLTYVILCGDSADKCPITPPHVKREHWGFDDPAGKEWSEFQRVRDEIGERIKRFDEIGK